MLKDLIRTISLAACLTLAYGQTGNSVTVTATRTLNVQPDQASFTVTVTTPTTASLNDVLAALPGTGIIAANLVSVGTSSIVSVLPPTQTPPAPKLNWLFSVTVPFSAMKNEFSALAGLPGAVKQKNTDFAASLAFSGATASQAALDNARTQILPDLINDARTKAKQLTDAAGLGLGGITALAESGTAWINTPQFIAVPSAQTVSGFVSFLGALYTVPPPPTINLAVTFTLLRFTNP